MRRYRYNPLDGDEYDNIATILNKITEELTAISMEAREGKIPITDFLVALEDHLIDLRGIILTLDQLKPQEGRNRLLLVARGLGKGIYKKIVELQGEEVSQLDPDQLETDAAPFPQRGGLRPPSRPGEIPSAEELDELGGLPFFPNKPPEMIEVETETEGAIIPFPVTPKRQDLRVAGYHPPKPPKTPTLGLPVMGGRGPNIDPMEFVMEGGDVELATVPGERADGMQYLLYHYQTKTPLYYVFYPYDKLPVQGQEVWTPLYHFLIDDITGNSMMVRPKPRWIYAVYGQVRGEAHPRIMYGVPLKSKIKGYKKVIADYFTSWGITKKKDYRVFSKEWKPSEMRRMGIPGSRKK